LALVLRHDLVSVGEIEPEEVKNAVGDTGHVGVELFVMHLVRLDVVRGEPLLPRGVVLVDRLDQPTDPGRIEAGGLPAPVGAADLTVAADEPVPRE
jgi:hypothetical protein